MQILILAFMLCALCTFPISGSDFPPDNSTSVVSTSVVSTSVDATSVDATSVDDTTVILRSPENFSEAIYQPYSELPSSFQYKSFICIRGKRIGTLSNLNFIDNPFNEDVRLTSFDFSTFPVFSSFVCGNNPDCNKDIEAVKCFTNGGTMYIYGKFEFDAPGKKVVFLRLSE